MSSSTLEAIAGTRLSWRAWRLLHAIARFGLVRGDSSLVVADRRHELLGRTATESGSRAIANSSWLLELLGRSYATFNDSLWIDVWLRAWTLWIG